MRVAEMIFLGILVVGALLAVRAFWRGVVKPFVQRNSSRRRHDAPWTVERDKSGQATQVQVVKAGEEPYLIGAAIPITLPQWEYEEVLVERLLEAQTKADALNRRLPR